MLKKKVTILITTKNRLIALKETLERMESHLYDERLEFIICDDGSTDGTHEFLKEYYPSIVLLRNDNSKGLIFSRNRLLGMVRTPYAISLDDDAHILTSDFVYEVEKFFSEHPECGVLAFRIFWGKAEPGSTETLQNAQQVRNFVGCGHAWRIQAWREIPNYPEWFIFYGEEEFASFEMFKAGWQIHYLPKVLIHHRVVVKDRRKESDYYVRLRRSLRAGWYNYLLFIPLRFIPKKVLYSFWMQLKLKALKGEVKILKPLFLAVWDVISNFGKIGKNTNRLSLKEYKKYKELAEAKIYWKPNE